MPILRPILNSADMNLLKKTFATKDDIKKIDTKIINLATKDNLKELASKKDLKRIENKLDEHFNYLDKDISHFRRKTAHHLGIPVSNLIKTS